MALEAFNLHCDYSTMAQMFRGDVSFRVHDKLLPHRFEVSVTDDGKMILSIEDRQSKKQWCVDWSVNMDEKPWVTGDGNAAGVITFYTLGYIGFSTAGVYANDIGVVHSGASNGPIYSLKRADTTLMTGYGCSKKGDFTTTPMQYTLIAKAGGEIHVLYFGTGRASASSFISIRKL